jgi:hypothetical protein
MAHLDGYIEHGTEASCSSRDEEGGGAVRDPCGTQKECAASGKPTKLTIKLEHTRTRCLDPLLPLVVRKA